jgi:hypothetical protein
MATRTVSHFPAQDKLAVALKAHPLSQVFEKLTDWRKARGRYTRYPGCFCCCCLA